MNNHEIQSTMSKAKEALRRYEYLTRCESIGAKQTKKYFPAIGRITTDSELNRKAVLELKVRGNWIGTMEANV